MPALLLALASMLTQLVSTFAGRLLLAIGFEFVTYTGVTFAFDSVKTAVNSYIGGLSGDVVGLVGLFGIPQAISIVFGAIAARVSISGIRNGSFTRLVGK